MDERILITSPTPVAVLSGLVIALAAMTGCARDVRSTYRFIVTDGSTGAPLSGVVVNAYGNGHYHYNRSFPGDESPPVLPTARDGAAAINGVITSGGWQYFFDFMKPGYRALTVTGGPEIKDSPWFFSYKNAEQLPADDAWASVRPLSRDLINEIPMYQLSVWPKSRVGRKAIHPQAEH